MTYNNDEMIFENLPDIVRPSSVAKLLDISIKTIYDWKYRGKMRNVPDDLFIKLNRSLYIKTKVLRRWVTSGY
jgi:predicted site-specific integrase-resolvase